MGFGSQFVDFDNNGSLELIITNGHVDRYARGDVAYRMPAQLYHRKSSGRWEELEHTKLGSYFQNDHLGRSLVKTDFNRDGRCDIAISHLGDPASLLVNLTPNAGHAVVIALKATDSPRNAVGAKVVAKMGDRTRVFYKLAGDGYMAANEQLIHIGCDKASRIDEVNVFWPSGRVDHLGSLDTGREYIIVEGEPKAFETRKLTPRN